MFQSAPPVKGAIIRPQELPRFLVFQSAPPVKGAIRREWGQRLRLPVSIRAPREGGDGEVLKNVGGVVSFNPRPP